MSKFLTPPVWYDKDGNLNDMLTGKASSDGVAVGSNAGAMMGGVAVGYNSGASNEGVAVGYKATANDYGIAIGSNVTSDGYGIAIGADATGNGIAIGGTAAANKVQLGSTNTTYDLTVGDGNGTINGARFGVKDGAVQIGDPNTTYTLNVGNGNGTLKIGSIEFRKQGIVNNRAIIVKPGVYLCCTTTPGDNYKVISDVAICFINSLDQPASVLSSVANLCEYSSTHEEIVPKDGSTMRYCFMIASL